MPKKMQERLKFLHDINIDTVYSRLYSDWFRRVFQLYILSFIIVIMLEMGVGYVMGKYSQGLYIGLRYTFRRVALPAFINGFLALLDLVIFRSSHVDEESKNWLMLIILVCIATVLSCVHSYFIARFAIFLVPVVSAIAFLSVGMLYSITALAVAAMGASLVLPVFWHDLTWAEMLAQAPNAGLTAAIALVIAMVEHVSIDLYQERERQLCDVVMENRQLGHAIETDELTGLYNRKGFIQHAEQAINAMPDGEYTLLFADVENFRGINERVGEQKADGLLCYIAQQLRKLASAEGSVCGRYGGDQFVVLLRDCPPDSEDGLSDFDTALRAKAPVTGVKINYGLCRDIRGGDPIVQCCDRARLALQSVKNQYEQFLAIYDTAMSQAENRRRMIEACMRDGIEKHHFRVFYQPKHDASTGRLVGAEALVRWKHPEYGVISPGEFIPALEKNGFILHLDKYVWHTVCDDLRGWIDSGIQPVPVSVNASRKDFLMANDVGVLTEPVERDCLDRGLLHIEVTESLYTDEAERIIPRVQMVRDAGFAIEMDDFGAGYSSLGMINKLPLDVLKLDMSFIRDMKNQKVILESMIYLARALNLKTVAEGVETEEELAVLRDMGCDYIQGFYFAKPMPKDEFTEYLKKHGNEG